MEYNEKKNLYEEVRKFKHKYPLSIMWRVRRHCKIVEKHMNPDEKILYAFAAQKNNNPFDVVRLRQDQRILRVAATGVYYQERDGYLGLFLEHHSLSPYHHTHQIGRRQEICHGHFPQKRTAYLRQERGLAGLLLFI